MSAEVDLYMPWNPEELELLLRSAVLQSVEGPKLDFKSKLSLDETASKESVAKDISALANTDDSGSFHDYGFLVLGAQRGRLIGGCSELASDHIDKTGAQLTQIIGGYISPTPNFYPVGFEDKKVGWWGAIVVPPSRVQPHQFIRDAAGASRGECWARVNDTNQRFSPQDYDRVFRNRLLVELLPFHQQLDELRVRTGQLEERTALGGLQWHAPIAQGTPELAVSSTGQVDVGANLAARIRARFKTPEDKLAEDITLEGAQLVNALRDDTEDFPWAPPSISQETAEKLLSRSEELARPLVEAVAAALEFDSKGVLDNAVLRAITTLTRQQRYPGGNQSFNSVGQVLRLYPLHLVAMTVMIYGVEHHRNALLGRVARLAVSPTDQRDSVLAIAEIPFRVLEASDAFNASLGGRRCAATSERTYRSLQKWLADGVDGSSFMDAFFRGEFVMALSSLEWRNANTSTPIPAPGLYLYRAEARSVIHQYLGRRPTALKATLAQPVEEVLKLFDENAGQVISSGCFADGFVSGATAAWASGSEEQV